MAAKLSTVIDTIRTAIPALPSFTGKKEIPNPYDLTRNDDNMLVDGWGLRVGTAANNFNELKFVYEETDMQIVLARQIFRLGHDQDLIHNTTKSLLDDMLEVKQDFLASDELGISDSVCKIVAGGSGGIEFIEGDKFTIISLSQSFLITTRESIS